MKNALNHLTSLCQQLTPGTIAIVLLAWGWAGPAFATPKNLIIMIGDGMGSTHLTAYRHFQQNPESDRVEPTIFDQLLTGLSGTYPDGDTLVTDSAASATALATGHKTCNQYVAISCDGQPLTGLFHKAKRAQMRTGIAVSSPVTHATPAAFYAQQESRHAHEAIADQLVDNTISDQLPVDVILGAGTDYLIREDRNLVWELQDAGYDYADSWEATTQLSDAPALALLGKNALPPALHSPVDKPLARLTDKALQLLAGGKDDPGFVLMVEASQIDWCSHANDIVCTLAEMEDFAQAVILARNFVDANPDTLLLITADHETGGLSLGSSGHYAWRHQVLRTVNATASELAGQLLASEDWLSVWREQTGIALEKDERDALSRARKKDETALADTIKAIVNTRSRTGWTTGGHTAADVPIMAYGRGSERFRGFIDNAEIGRRLLEMID